MRAASLTHSYTRESRDRPAPTVGATPQFRLTLRLPRRESAFAEVGTPARYMTAMRDNRGANRELGNVRFGSKADIPRHSHLRLLLGAKRTYPPVAHVGALRHEYTGHGFVDALVVFAPVACGFGSSDQHTASSPCLTSLPHRLPLGLLPNHIHPLRPSRRIICRACFTTIAANRLEPEPYAAPGAQVAVVHGFAVQHIDAATDDQ